MNRHPFNDLMLSVDGMTISKKTTLLFLIMLIGMLFIGGFAHLSINRIKNNFDILYTKRMLPTIRLENLKDIYTVNILDTIRDIEKGSISAKEGKAVIALAQELITMEVAEYKSSLTIDDSDWLVQWLRSWHKESSKKQLLNEDEILMQRIEQKIHTVNGILLQMFDRFDHNETSKAILVLQNELYPSVYSINIDLTSLISLNFIGANEGYSRTSLVYNSTFEWIVLGTVATILIAALFALILLQNIRLLHMKLQKVVDEKTKELKELNNDLALKVEYEVEQSRKKDQIMFRQSRLASMGEMIGNIAHQWRQPLNAMVLIIQSFQMKRMAGLPLNDDFIDKQVEDGLALAGMMSHTIDDFRNFFKPNRDAELFSLKECVAASIKLIHEYYTKCNIQISFQSLQDSYIMGYPNEISQVLMNLFSNAKDALESFNPKEKLIEVVIFEEDKKSIIRVVDNGGGLSDEVLDRMFEPYFTTKYKSSGTGIGLYMSKQIIEKQMQGTISGSSVEYRFENTHIYQECAMITIIIPHEKEEK